MARVTDRPPGADGGPAPEVVLSPTTSSPGGPIDRRLLGRVRATRRYLVVATAVGAASAGLVVVQAVLLASIVSDVVLHHAGVGAVAARSGGLAAAFALRALLSWVGEVASARTSASVVSALRQQLLDKALALGPTWLSGERSGELSVTVTRGLRSLDDYFGRYLPQALLAALTPVIVLAWVGAVDWPSVLILLALVAAVPWAMAWFGRKARTETDRQWRRLGSLAGRYLELLQGLPTLRAVGCAARGREEVSAATEALRRSTLRTLRVGFLSSLVLDLIAGLGVGLVAMALGLRLLDGSLPLSVALSVLLVAPEVFVPLRRAAAEWHASAEGKAAAARVLEVLDIPETTQRNGTAGGRSGSGGHETVGGPGGGARVPDAPRGGRWPVLLEEVRVTYPPRDTTARPVTALDRLDLRIDDGEHLALLGPSGAGKSTVIALLLRFVTWEAGTVTAGGVDMAAISPDEWRRSVTWVPQRPHLFQGTLADNLRLGDPGAGDRRLAGAVEACGLDDLLRRLPHGLESPIAQGGSELSGGERRRVALARAVLKDAPLVLLDEPSLHLESRDVDELAERLAPWLAERAVVVAGHGDHLVRRLDRSVRLVAPRLDEMDVERAGEPAVADSGAR